MDWQPASVEETELVACVGPAEKYVLQVCPYSGGTSTTRYAYRREVTVVSAKTAEIIDSATFKGEAPRACREWEERSLETLKRSKELDRNEVLAWLSEYVVPGQEADSAPYSEEQQPKAEHSSEPRAQPVATVPEPPTASMEIQPEPKSSVIPVEEIPPAIVTPGSQPPAIGALTGNPSLWSGPNRPDSPGKHLGIILKKVSRLRSCPRPTDGPRYAGHPQMEANSSVGY
jgi:hypothetical protein